MVIEARLGHSERWVDLVRFDLWLPKIMTTPGNYITYSNTRWELTAEDRAKIDASTKRLMQALADSKSEAETEPREAIPPDR